MKNSRYIFQYVDIKALTAHAVVQCKAIFQLAYASSEVNWKMALHCTTACAVSAFISTY